MKWERRSAKLTARRRRMRQHGRAIGRVYQAAVQKRAATVPPFREGEGRVFPFA